MLARAGRAAPGPAFCVPGAPSEAAHGQPVRCASQRARPCSGGGGYRQVPPAATDGQATTKAKQDLTQRRRGTRRNAEMKYSLRLFANLCASALDLCSFPLLIRARSEEHTSELQSL